MANELVGLENLPNAFIKQIKLTDYNQNMFEMSVTVNVKDAIDNGDYIWSSDPIMAPLVNVGLICLTDTSLIDQLTDGSLGPMDKSLSSYRKSLAVKDKVPNGNNVNYNHIFTETYPNKLPNLTIFAFCFIDSTVKDFGPIKSEKVINNFKIADKTTIFKLPDASLWAGPVHMNSGKYMAGSSHGPQDHPVLTAQIIKNFKIKNLTSRIQRPSGFEEIKSSPFTALTVSVDEETNFTGMFTIDVRNVLMNNTKYGKFLFNASKELFNQLISKFMIKSLITQRQRVDLDLKGHTKKITERENLINSYDDSSGVIKNFTKVNLLSGRAVVLSELPSSSTTSNMDPKKIYRQQVTKENTLAEIKELFLTGNSLRSFSFTDFSKRRTSPGNYRYTVAIQFYDPTLDLIKSINDTMVLDLSNIKSYLEFKMRRSSYDYKNNQSKIEDYPQADLNLIIKNYVTYYSYVDEVSVSDQRLMVDNLYSLISPKNSTVSDTKRFVEMYEALRFQLFNNLDYDDKKSQNKVGRFGLKSDYSTNRILTKKTFNKIFTPSSNFNRINYLDNQTKKGLKVYTKQQFSGRIQEEVSKFFSSTPNFNTGENSSLLPSVVDALSNISTNSTQFLSPISISSADLSQDTKRIENINIQETNKILRSTALLSKSNKFSIKKITTNDTTDPIDQFLPIGDVIGTSTSQAAYSDNESSENEPYGYQPSTLKLKDLDGNLNSKVLRQQDFDISTPSFSLNAQESLDLPLQVKALLGSKLSSTNNALLNSPTDAISSPETRNIVNLNFTGVQEIQFLKGYGITSGGYLDLSNPIWAPMDSKSFQKASGPVVCRMVQYSNNSLSLNVNVSQTMNIVDKTFIISDKNLRAKPSSTLNNFVTNNTLQDVATFEFTNSNIITQTNESITIDQTPQSTGNTRQPASLIRRY
jgi:hypothetical protein